MKTAKGVQALRAGLMLVVLALFMLPLGSPSYSQSNSQIDSLRKQRNKLYEKVKKLRGEKLQLNEVVGQIDNKIEEYDEQLQTVQDQLDTANKKYEEHSQRSEELREMLSERRSDLSERARVIFMQGDLTYLDLLFQATDMNDLVDRMFFMQAIMENDQKLVVKTEEGHSQLEKEMATLKEQMAEIKVIEQSLQEVLDKYEAQRSERELHIRAIESDEALAMKSIKELEEESKRVQRELKSRKSTYGGKWSGKFNQPCAGSITSGFGYRKHPVYKTGRMHTGIDIGAKTGTSIFAAENGVVISAKTRGGYGKCVMIDHGTDSKGRNVVTLYGHMSKILCKDGQKVSAGDLIGLVGSTGLSTGPHLHFEVRLDGEPVDPAKY